MNISRIENLINEHGNENSELLADLDELRRQNTEYDNDFNRIREANDTLTSALENSRAENYFIFLVILKYVQCITLIT